MLSVRLRTGMWIEVFPPILLAAIHLILGWQMQEMQLVEKGVPRVGPLLISVAPVLLGYFMVRWICKPLTSLVLIGSALLVLSIAHKTKFSLTNEPLSWTDVSSLANVSIIDHYISGFQLALLAGLCIACVAVFFLEQPVKRSFGTILVQIGACIILSILALYPYIDKLDKEIAVKATSLLSKMGVRYIAWDWGGNVKKNGLPLHLIQTSRRIIPASPTKQDVDAFDALKGSEGAVAARPSTVVYILCEACWHDAVHFKSHFSGLETLGLQPFRAVSPVYGGGTVNASFELLTGLPSSGVLSGIIYQEYAPLISTNAHTFPRYLKKAGYNTVAAHNNQRKFWRRDIVKPKLGFDRFLGLEDMTNEKVSGWADDAILFDSAFKVLVDNKNQPKYLYLTTVYTHGGYSFNNDYGEEDYESRLATTVNRVSEFIKKVIAVDKNALILVVADHKPALTKYFYEKRILNDQQFTAVGQKNEDFRFSHDLSRELVGDVPAYIYHQDSTRVRRFVERASNLPFFCLSYILDDEFIRVGLPSFQFSREKNICVEYPVAGYHSTIGKYPDWLYSLSLLDQPR